MQADDMDYYRRNIGRFQDDDELEEQYDFASDYIDEDDGDV